MIFVAPGTSEDGLISLTATSLPSLPGDSTALVLLHWAASENKALASVNWVEPHRKQGFTWKLES
jgi:hypothetical protein